MSAKSQRPTRTEQKKHPGSSIPTEREFSAGGLIWRRSAKNGVEVVLVQPAGRDTWVLPKGGLEARETAQQAAIRECREETGFTVEPQHLLGRVSYFYIRRELPNGPPCRVFKKVDFFLMKFRSGDPSQHDSEIQDVRWFMIDDAPHWASYRNERDLINKARELLARQPTP